MGKHSFYVDFRVFGFVLVDYVHYPQAYAPRCVGDNFINDVKNILHVPPPFCKEFAFGEEARNAQKNIELGRISSHHMISCGVSTVYELQRGYNSHGCTTWLFCYSIIS